jgi:hypothetical protein
MILTRWQATLSVILVTMMLLCLAVWAGVRGCDPPVADDDDCAAGDDDSATDDDDCAAAAIAAELRELDAEFSDPDETYQPGVL